MANRTGMAGAQRNYPEVALPKIGGQDARLAGISTDHRCLQNDLDVLVFPVAGGELLGRVKTGWVGDAASCGFRPEMMDSCYGDKHAPRVRVNNAGDQGVVNDSLVQLAVRFRGRPFARRRVLAVADITKLSIANEREPKFAAELQRPLITESANQNHGPLHQVVQLGVFGMKDAKAFALAAEHSGHHRESHYVAERNAVATHKFR